MRKRVVVILTFIVFVAYRESGLYPNNPGFEIFPAREPVTAVETIPTPEAIPQPEPEEIAEPEEITEPESLTESEPIRALQEIPYLDNFLVETTETINETEYALEDNFWMILGPLVLSLITILFCLMMYFHRRRVSATMAEERRLNFQQVVDIPPTIMEENVEDDEDEDFAHFLDELNSLRTMVMEDESPADFQNDRDSVRNLAMRAEERRLRFQQRVDIMQVIIQEDEEEGEDEFEDEDGACSPDELNSVRTMEEEGESPADFHNMGDSPSNLKIRAVDRHLRFQQIEDTIPVVLEEEQHDAHYPDAVDSLKIKTERLPLMLAEETIGHQASMETHVKMQRQRKNCIVASKATGKKEKKVQMNKTGVGLTPPSNFKASRAKVVSQTSPCHRPGGRDVKKVDYSKVKAKVDTWRKT
jgi:hypothetical protein